MRHKWSGKVIGYKLDAQIPTFCVRCGCIKEWIKGYPTYLLNDEMYDKFAPECKPKLKLMNEDGFIESDTHPDNF